MLSLWTIKIASEWSPHSILASFQPTLHRTASMSFRKCQSYHVTLYSVAFHVSLTLHQSLSPAVSCWSEEGQCCRCAVGQGGICVNPWLTWVWLVLLSPLVPENEQYSDPILTRACVCLSCCKKIWETGWLKQQTLTSHSPGGGEVRDQGSGRFGVWWGLLPGFQMPAFFLCSPVVEKERELWSPLFLTRTLIPLWGPYPHDFI